MGELDAILACPHCGASLTVGADAVLCTRCGASYTVIDGIPVILGTDSVADGQKAEQARWFDCEPNAAFEVERPTGTPRLYGWYYAEKFRRGTRALSAGDGRMALAVCGGSGMDAEFLAGAGWSVVSIDMSLGASRRAQERARRHRFPLHVVVGDAERLPFADESFELVYVHDGLHHLADPGAALREMARVARQAVSVNEPARAAVTAAAVRLGLALKAEEAGNVVNRLARDEVETTLRQDGFRIVSSSRYAMYFRHEPGGVIAWLSRPLPFAVTRFALRVANLLLGRIGNKLTVQAMRVPQASIGEKAA